jgi:hypothetical protein
VTAVSVLVAIKASDRHAFYPFLLMHKCFSSSVHDRLVLKVKYC